MARNASLQEFKAAVLAQCAAKARGAPLPATVVIDVREPMELQQSGAVPCALNIPMGQLEEQLASGGDAFFAKAHGLPQAPDPKATTLFFTCAAGVRSVYAMQIAEAVGFRNTCHYPGGWYGYVKDPLSAEEVAAASSTDDAENP